MESIDHEGVGKPHLRGRPTYVGYPGAERIRVSAAKTDEYLEWLKELVKFAELVYDRKARVIVWA